MALPTPMYTHCQWSTFAWRCMFFVGFLQASSRSSPLEWPYGCPYGAACVSLSLSLCHSLPPTLPAVLALNAASLCGRAGLGLLSGMFGSSIIVCLTFTQAGRRQALLLKLSSTCWCLCWLPDTQDKSQVLKKKQVIEYLFKWRSNPKTTSFRWNRI